MLAQHLQRLIWRGGFRILGRIMPEAAARGAGRILGRLLYTLGFRKAIAIRNLRMAFPELPAGEVDRLACRSLQSLAIVYFEIPRLRHLSDAALNTALTVENLRLLTSLDSRGALLLSGHVGNWELLAVGAAYRSGRSFAIVVKGQKDFGELELTRKRRGNTTIPMHKSALQTSRILSQGGVVAMLVDQSAPEREPLVGLFGIPTRVYSAPAKLALRYRPKVIVGFAVRETGAAYCAELRELQYDDLEDTPDGVREFTQRYTAMLEEVVRMHPEQWVWHHRRWKNSPGVSYD